MSRANVSVKGLEGFRKNVCEGSRVVARIHVDFCGHFVSSDREGLKDPQRERHVAAQVDHTGDEQYLPKWLGVNEVEACAFHEGG